MDIVQDTLIAAMPKIVELRPRNAAGLLQWFAAIATNRIRDGYDHLHAAKRDSRREVQQRPGSEPAGSIPEQAGDATPPDLRAQISEVRTLLDEAVAHLPKDQQRVVLLRDYFGDDWEHITHVLGRETPHAARQLHQRAWIRLRQVLRPKLVGPERHGG